MRWRYPTALFLVCLPLLIVVPAAGAAPISVTCNGGGCSPDWYRTGVVVAFHGIRLAHRHAMPGVRTPSVSRHGELGSLSIVTSITAQRYCGSWSNDQEGRCAANGHGRLSESRSRFERLVQPSGWNQLQRVGCDIGLAGCNSTTYGGPDSAGASFSGTCTDNAGNVSAPASFGPIQYDATPPSVSVSLSRGPDSGGWYNHPVDFQANGSDNLSGIASCNSGTFGGGGSVSASCSDRAGNVGGAGVPVNYDSSAPSDRQHHLRSSAGQQRLVQPCGPRVFPRQRWGSGIGACTD